MGELRGDTMVIAQLNGEEDVDGVGKYERSLPTGVTWSNIVPRRHAPTIAGLSGGE